MKKIILFIAVAFIYSNSFSQSVPDAESFIKAFKTIEPTIFENFKKITGKDIGKTAYGDPLNATTINNLPGTLTNYIEFAPTYGYGDDAYYYFAPIDTTSSKKALMTKMQQWKQMLIKAFPEEARSIKEEITSYQQYINFPHREMSSKWTVSLKYVEEKGRPKLFFMIENEW